MSRIVKEISEKLEQAKKEVIIIGGDFNARIGRERKLYSGEPEEKQGKRKSKDKVGEEEKLLKMAAESGWHILNGNMEDDEKGEFMYIQKKGGTVIDCVLTNTIGLDKINSRLEAKGRPSTTDNSEN